MKRREFIVVFGGAAVAWPLGLDAQGRMPQVGILLIGPPDNPNDPWRDRFGVFQQAMETLGWRDGTNVRFEYHYTLARSSDEVIE